jgi:hypothetical protein
MSSLWRSLPLAGAFGLVGCNQAALPGTGGLNGVGTVSVVRVSGSDGGAQVDAQYGQIAFLTSANSDDLKGLQLILTDPSQTRNYVPAPNPLQPLSIPVVNQPVELAPSVRYGPITTTLPYFPTGFMDGQVRTGMLLFVRGSASPNISVVGTANVPESLRQLTNGLLIQSAGVVTAISARLTSSEQNVVLYYATFDGENATVWERVLQHPPTTSPTFSGPFPTSLTYVFDCSGPPPQLPSSTLYVCPQRPVRTYENASVSALQVLPTIPTDAPLAVLGGLEGGRLGVALRELAPPSPSLNDAGLSSAGELRIIDPALPADLNADGTSSDPYFRLARYFPPFDNAQPPLIAGAPPQPPVRALLTHPRAFNIYPDGGALPPGGPSVLAYEGARLFGVLDESSCHGALGCTGIIAVDSAPFLPDGGPNANYGLLAFDASDCLTMSNDAQPPPGGQYTYCANEMGTTNRMLPLRVGNGVIQGVAFESTVSFPAPTSFTQGLIPLLGVVTISAESLDHSSPQIFFFDGLGLRALNENAGPGITNGMTLVVPGVLTAAVDAGVTGVFIMADAGVGLYPITETLTITNEGEIPGLTLIQGIPYDAGILANGEVAPVLAWPVPDAGAVVAVYVLEVNDLLFPINLSGTVCTVFTDAGTLATPFALVTGVDDAGANIFTNSLDLRLCPGASGYIAVAGPDSEFPFLVSGSSQGLLGRMAAGQQPQHVGDPVIPGPVFIVPNSITAALGINYPRFYNPSVPPGTVIQGDFIFPPGSDAGLYTPPLALQLPPPDFDFLSNAQAYYTFIFSSGFLGAALPIDNVGLGFGGLFLPGGAAQTRIIDVNGEFILDIIAYPSSNTVIDYSPSVLLLNTPNSGPINVHF